MSKETKRNEWIDTLAGAAEWRGVGTPQSARAWYQILTAYSQHLLATKRSTPNQLRSATLQKVVSALRWAEQAGMVERTPRGYTQDVDMYRWKFVHIVEQAEDSTPTEPASESSDDDDDDGGPPAPVVWF